MEIIGVDFSGAQGDSNTWIAEGDFDGNCLTLRRCYGIKRNDLTRKLLESAADSVAALDFPFSVPQAFADFWNPQSQVMPDLWRTAAQIDLDQFIAYRNDFVTKNQEPKRACDKLCCHSAKWDRKLSGENRLNWRAL
ncbi:MAG: hypothetical protein O2821_02790, partial [Chloroflexi bacterium]|nr:hypothetical protein [Chloroflexota bacterium]